MNRKQRRAWAKDMVKRKGPDRKLRGREIRGVRSAVADGMKQPEEKE